VDGRSTFLAHGRVTSTQLAQSALVSMADFIAAQGIDAARDPPPALH
jgi:hypothetical protein